MKSFGVQNSYVSPSFSFPLSKELFGFFSLSSHVDILSEPLNSCLHVFHHVVETTVKCDWSILMVKFDEKVCKWTSMISLQFQLTINITKSHLHDCLEQRERLPAPTSRDNSSNSWRRLLVGERRDKPEMENWSFNITVQPKSVATNLPELASCNKAD